MGIPFGDPPLLSLVPQAYFCWDYNWNFPVGASELIPFVARLDRFCYSRSAEIPSRGFLLVFPRWGFTLIVRSQGTQFPPVGGLLLFSFLGELHIIKEHTIHHFSELGWKNLINSFEKLRTCLFYETKPSLHITEFNIFYFVPVNMRQDNNIIIHPQYLYLCFLSLFDCTPTPISS